MKKNIFYFIPLALALLLYILVEIARPRPIDWSETYKKDDKIPFGCYIAYTLLSDLFPKQPVVVIDANIYETLKKPAVEGSNYIFIAEAFTPDSYDVNSLAEFVDNGGNVFVSARRLGTYFTDTLGIELEYEFEGEDNNIALRLVNPKFAGRENIMQLDKVHLRSYFSSFDTAKTTVLGMDQTDRINFIAVPYGRGTFYLHLIPQVFTNYGLMHDNSTYAASTLSYLPAHKTLWDEYYKASKLAEQTPLSFILSTPSLQWAWRLALATVVLFIAFEMRRRQRIIPIIKPPANATLDFVTTVGKLYFQHGDLKNIAEKKITYFLDYIRTRLNIPTSQFDNKFIELVTGRSGVPELEVRSVIRVIKQVQSTEQISAQGLVELHKHIENFYKKSAR